MGLAWRLKISGPDNLRLSSEAISRQQRHSTASPKFCIARFFLTIPGVLLKWIHLNHFWVFFTIPGAHTNQVAGLKGPEPYIQALQMFQPLNDPCRPGAGNLAAFAAIRADGHVVTWGASTQSQGIQRGKSHWKSSSGFEGLSGLV